MDIISVLKISKIQMFLVSVMMMGILLCSSSQVQAAQDGYAGQGECILATVESGIEERDFIPFNSSQISDLLEGVSADYTATPIVEIGINPNNVESAGILVGLKDVRDAQGNDVLDAKLAGYQIELVYDHLQTKILDVVDKANLGQITLYNEPDSIEVSVTDIVYQGTGNVEKLFFVPLALIGAATNTTSVIIKFTSLTDLNLNRINISDVTLIFQRGKILNDANHRIHSTVDAVAGLQYLAEIIDFGIDEGKVNVINMASILQPETETTSKPSVKDVIALMQYLVGLRDDSFHLPSESVSVPALKIGSCQIAPGETRVVAITGHNIPSPGLAGYQISIEYDPLTLEVIGLEKSASDSFSMQLPNFDLPGKVRLAAIQTTGITGEITLARLRIKAKDSAVGSTDLKLTIGDLVLANLKPLQVQVINGLVDISAESGQYPLPLTISIVNLPKAVINQPYSTTLIANNGNPPYVWSASGLPDGLNINTQTGEISGIPTSSAVTSLVHVSISDSQSPVQTVSIQLPLEVVEGSIE